MGRRELLIALAFVAVGIVAYQFSAPPAKTAQGFSLSKLFNSARRQMQSDRAQATYTQTGTLTAGPGLSEIRVAHITRGITITGEPRTDIAYELKVNSTGPDEETALSYAKRTALKVDDLGTALSLAADYPAEGSQFAELTLHVPGRLAARLDNSQSAKVRVTGIAGLRLDSASGDAQVDRIVGAVTGQFRAGTLNLTDVQSVDLTLSATSATIDGVREGVTITTRAGRCHVLHASGAVQIDATNTEVDVEEPAGAVHVGASGGRVTVVAPAKQADVEGRRTEIEVTLAAAVPLTLITSNDSLRLRFRGAPPAVALDAVASDGGTIHAEDPRLAPTTDDHGARLTFSYGGATAPRVVLRNTSGEIVIGVTK